MLFDYMLETNNKIFILYAVKSGNTVGLARNYLIFIVIFKKTFI